jgi:hypothetical protein
MFINGLYSYRLFISGFILPFLLFSGIFFTWGSASGSENSVNEIILTEPVSNNLINSFSAGEKKTLPSSNDIPQAAAFNSILKESNIVSYNRSFNRISLNEIRLYPFLSAHFATST